VSLSPFLGNDSIVAQLESRVRTGRFPHALLFSGPDGIGKHTFAVRLIQALNCSGHQVPACGECDSCSRIGRGTHPDVRTVGVAEDASQIRIEQIRDLRGTLALAPLEGRIRAWIIDPAERLSAGAANALLKVLEEPPPRICFFLITTNASELLLTIRSRCQIHHFAPLPLASLRELAQATGEVAAEEWLIRWSGGSVGWLRRADPDMVREIRERMLTFLEAGWSGGPEALAGQIGTPLAGNREEFPLRLRAACLIISDLVYLAAGNGDRITNIDLRERLEKLSSGLSIPQLADAATRIHAIEKGLKSYLNLQLMSDDLLVSLAEAARGPGKYANDKPTRRR
jgi:DNA polymerase III subunit delta'